LHADSVIRVSNLTKEYRLGDADATVRALDGVDLSIGRGEYVALVGVSGSGKSTLMNILGCLDRGSSGSYELNGAEVSQLSRDQLAQVRNRDIGFVFQNFNLLTRADALANVVQPLRYRRIDAAERRRKALAMLERVGLQERAHHLPNQLSGGQRQRVAVARALVTEPRIILADEPTGNLDTRTTEDVMALFDSINAQGQTIIVVTHEPAIAERCKRRIRLLDGRIVSDDAHA
jgi:putative ABC transport system ATP-binding protein